MAAATGPQNYGKSYRADPVSCREARRDTEMILSVWGLDSVADTTCQVLAELMANAVEYGSEDPGKSTVEMRVIRTFSGVRLEVRDACRLAPVPRQTAPTDEDGRGLFLVSVLASEWGWELHRSGKQVWAEIAL